MLWVYRSTESITSTQQHNNHQVAVIFRKVVCDVCERECCVEWRKLQYRYYILTRYGVFLFKF